MTIRETIQSASRLAGLTAISETPSADELQVGLEVFQNLIQGLPKVRLTDVIISAAYTAKEYERVFNAGSVYAVTLPTTITDVVSGEVRPPLNGAVVEVVGTTTVRSIWISELGAWQTVSGLTLSSTQPFGPEHEQGLRAMTAARLAIELQRPDVSQWVLSLAEEGRRMIRQRFHQTYKVTTDPLLLNIFQRYGVRI